VTKANSAKGGLISYVALTCPVSPVVDGSCIRGSLTGNKTGHDMARGVEEEELET
jgi:hypothetical protein